MLFDIPLDQITEAHLQSLMTDRVAEDRQLEYKLTLPTKQRSDVKEFLKDIYISTRQYDWRRHSLRRTGGRRQ
jgi:hypothetical protein